MTTVPTLATAALLLAIAAPAGAAVLDDPFSGLPAMTAVELGSHRGGMMIGGIPMDFAVVVRTTVEGAVAQGLQTLLTVNDRGGLGSATTTPVGNLDGASLSPTADGGMSLNLPSGTNIVHDVGVNQVQTLIANTRNNVNLNHRTDVNIDMPGFTAMTQTWYGNNRAAQLGIDAARGSLGRY